MPEPADRPPLRDQIASAIGGTMILRTSVDEITEAVMQVVHPHLKPQAEAARRMDDPGPLRDRIARRGAPVSDLRAALDRLTDDERRHILNGLAALHPADVERQAAYVHARRVWYPTPPTPAAEQPKETP